MSESRSSNRGRLLRQGAEMIAWQGLARAGSFAASIWAARCLGPANLGISAMVIATITQGALLINLNQNNALVRSYRDGTAEAERRELVREALSFRLFAALAVAGIALVVLVLVPHDPAWNLAVFAGLPLLVSESNQPLWLLQSRDLAPVIHRSAFVQTAVLLTGYALFMRPGASPGLDLLCTVTGSVIATGLGWIAALRHLALRPDVRAAGRYLRRLREGRWLIVAGVSNYVYNSSFVALAGYLVSVTDAGLFRVANSVAMQLSVLTAIGQQLIFPRFLELSRRDPAALRRWQTTLVRAVLAVGAPVTVLAAVWGGDALALIFGPAYLPVAPAFALVIATRFFAAAASVYTFGLWARHFDRHVAASMSTLALLTLTFSFLLIPRYGVTGVGLAALLAETSSLVLNWAINRRAGRTPLVAAASEAAA